MQPLLPARWPPWRSLPSRPWLYSGAPVPPGRRPGCLARLIAALDADEFATREGASQRLALFGEAAVPALRAAQASKPSAELRRRIEALLELAATSDFLAPSLRVCRALEVLEACGSAEARRLLAVLATGEPKAWLTREARASLTRLAQQGQNR